MKKIVLYIISSFTMSVFIGSLMASNPNMPKDLQEKDNIRKQTNNSYIVKKTQEYLACPKILFIKDNNVVYLKNEKEEVVYIIEINDYKGSCVWQRDVLKFKKATDKNIANKLSEDYDTKFYLDIEFNLIFTIKKIRQDENLNISKINIPYFIVLNDYRNDNIKLQQNDTIEITLPKKGQSQVKTKKIKLNVEFPKNELIYHELLAGIHFTQQ